MYSAKSNLVDTRDFRVRVVLQVTLVFEWKNISVVFVLISIDVMYHADESLKLSVRRVCQLCISW
jgi:hypothetical protein